MKEKLNFPNEDGNNYYYYDIQGQRKSLMGEGDFTKH